MAYNENQLTNQYKGTIATIKSGTNFLIASKEEDIINYRPFPFLNKTSYDSLGLGSYNRKLLEYKIEKEILSKNYEANKDRIVEINELVKKLNIKKPNRADSNYALYSMSNLINNINITNSVNIRNIVKNEDGSYGFEETGLLEKLTSKSKKNKQSLGFAGITNNIYNSDSFKEFSMIDGINNINDFNNNYGVPFLTINNYERNAYNLTKDSNIINWTQTLASLEESKKNRKLSPAQLKFYNDTKRNLNKYVSEKQLGYDTFAFIPQENGSYNVSEVGIKYNFKWNTETKKVDFTSNINSFKNTDINFFFNTDMPFMPGKPNIMGKTSGFTDTPGASEVWNVMNNLMRENTLRASLNMYGFNDINERNAATPFIENLASNLRKSTKIFSDSQNFNLGESAGANWLQTMQLKFTKYDVTTDGPKYESEQYLLTSGMFKNLFVKNDDVKQFMFNVNKSKGLDLNLKNEKELMNLFNSSSFSISIDNNDNITRVTMLNDKLGLTNDGRSMLTFGLNAKENQFIKNGLLSLNTKAMTVKLKSREELIQRFAYSELIGQYSKDNFGLVKNIVDNKITNSIDYYNAVAASLNLMPNRKAEFEQMNVYRLFFAKEIGDFDNFKYGEKVFNNKKQQLRTLDNLVTQTVNDINYGFIRREELETYTGIKFNRRENDPTHYLQNIINNNIKLDQRLRSRIENQLQLVNETSMRAFYATGENILLAGNVGKQGANAQGKVNLLESIAHPLAFIDTASQRKHQGMDDFGALRIGETDVSAVISKALGNIPGMEYHKTFLVNETKIGIREGLEKLYRDNYISKTLTDTEYKDYLKGKSNPKFDSLAKALEYRMNGMHANNQYVVPVKMLHANTKGSWQDSDMLATTAKMKMIYSPDQIRNVKIDINDIDYTKVKNLSGEFYTNKQDFLNDWDSIRIKGGVAKNPIETSMFDETTSFGNIIKQILGKDYEKVKLHRTNPNLITNEIQALSNEFSEDVLTGNSPEDSVLAINSYNKRMFKIMKDNLISFENGGGSIGNEKLIGTAGRVNKANMGFVSGVDVQDNILNLHIAKAVLGGSGGKAMIDSIKLTENGMNTDMLLYNFEGKDLLIDGIVNTKSGKLKRGFNGSTLNAIFNTMTINAINTPLINESGNEFEIKANRLKVLQEKIFDVPIIEMATTKNSELKKVSLSQLFGLQYSIDEKTGNVNVRSRFYDEAYQDFQKQFQRGAGFANVSLENFVVQKFYNNAKSLGLDMSPQQMEIFSPTLLEKLYNVHEEYIKNNLDPQYAQNAKIFLKGAGTLKKSVITKNGVEFRNFENVSDSLNFILYHNLNGMDDSISQKEQSALLSSTSFLNILRQQGANYLEEALTEKSKTDLNVLKYKQVANRFISNKRTLSLDNLIDYRGYTIDDVELNKYNKYADAKITREGFLSGEYFLSDILDLDTKGTKTPIKIFGSSLYNDRFGRAVNLGSSVSKETKSMNIELGKIIQQNVFDINKDAAAWSNIDFTDEQLIKLNSHIKDYLKTGNKEKLLTDYISDLITFQGDNTLNEIRNSKDINIKNQYGLYKSGARKRILGYAEDLKEVGYSKSKLANTEAGQNIEAMLGMRINFLSKLVGSDKNFAGEIFTNNLYNKNIYGDKLSFIEDVITNGFSNEELNVDTDNFLFDLSRLSISDDGTFVYNSNFDSINKYARLRKEFNSLNRISGFLESDDFKKATKTLTFSDFDSGINIYQNLARNGTSLEDIADSFIYMSNKNKGISYQDRNFYNFIQNNFKNIQNELTEAQTIGTRDENGLLLITDNVSKLINKYSKSENNDTYYNAFYFVNKINKELDNLDTIRKTDKAASDRYEILTQIKNEVQNKYINGTLKQDIIDTIYNGETNNEYIKNMFGEFSTYDTSGEIKEINRRKVYVGKKLDELKNNGKLAILDFVSSLKQEEDTKYVNSLNISPSEGTALNNHFLSWINGNTGASSLFFEKDGTFREGKSALFEMRTFKNLTNRIYGGFIDLEKMNKTLNTAQEMIKNGASEEEVKKFLSKYTNSIEDDLNNIVGLTLVDWKHYNKLIKNSAGLGKDGYVYGQLVRNPTIYQTSILPTKIVGINKRDIERGSFLSTMFGTGDFDNVDRITSFNIGQLTQLVMNGDYDGDKIYAALISQLDTNNDELVRKVYRETMLDNSIMNIITKKGIVFDYIDRYTYGDKINKNGSNILFESLDYYVKNKGLENLSPEELRKVLKQDLGVRIFNYENGLQLMMEKFKDELEDADKTMHIPEMKYKLESGQEVIPRNSFWFKLYNSIQNNEKSDIASIKEERLGQYFSKAKNVQPFFENLTDEEKDTLEDLIKNPKKAIDIYKNIFEDKNKNKTLRIKLSSFGEITNFRSYADNIKTGIASYELATVGRLAKFLVGEEGYEDFIEELGSTSDEYKLDTISKDEFIKSIRTLTGADLYGVLPEKAISSKHGTKDSAEALITSHKNIVKKLNSMIINSGDISMFSNASKSYVNLINAETVKDLEKVNLRDYLKIFGTVESQNDTIENYRTIVRELMKLTGVYDDEKTEEKLLTFGSYSDFSMDKIFGLWLDNPKELNDNGKLNFDAKHTVMRALGHLNEILIDKFSDIYKDELKIQADADKINLTTVKALFRDINEKTIEKKFKAVTGQDNTKIKFHGVISGWKKWFKGELPEKVEETTSENKIEDAVESTLVDLENSDPDKKIDEVLIPNSRLYKKFAGQGAQDYQNKIDELSSEYDKKRKEIKKEVYKDNTLSNRQKKTEYNRRANLLQEEHEAKVKATPEILAMEYKKQIEQEVQEEFQKQVEKVNQWESLGQDAQAKMFEEQFEEKSNILKQQVFDRSDLSLSQKKVVFKTANEQLKEQVRSDVQQQYKAVKEGKPLQSAEDILEQNINTFVKNKNSGVTAENTINKAVNEIIEDTSAPKLVQQSMFDEDGNPKIVKASFEEIINKIDTNDDYYDGIDASSSNIVDTIQDTVSNKTVEETANIINEKTINQTADTINETANKTAEQVTEAASTVYDTVKKTASKAGEEIKDALKSKKVPKTGLAIGIGAALVGGFISLLNRNRTVVHLEMNEQLNQQPQQGGGYGTVSPINNMQMKMGNYQIYTNIRDTF